MRLLACTSLANKPTELVHIGLVTMMSNSGAELLNRTCFTYPTLDDLYKYISTRPMRHWGSTMGFWRNTTKVQYQTKRTAD
jgi:hypothetical protein